MVRIKWKVTSVPSIVQHYVIWKWRKVQLGGHSLFYNHFMDQSYVIDVCMEPIFWFVDNFTKFLGPFFVFAVCSLTASVVCIAYWLGVPYWWDKSPTCTVFLMTVGHWLLLNICFHYYMAATTAPGYPPEGTLIPEAASICKKCIAPKPPRTHHCSVCNTCILKMDHHCPWLNNCIGHFNHRYFFLYMVYMCLGVFFLIVFGFELAYTEVWLEDEDEDNIEGHPVRFNNSILIPVTEIMVEDNVSTPITEYKGGRSLREACIIYMAFITSGVLVALGTLTMWHAQLISKGETSIEANINKAERKRHATINKIYTNPYDFGRKRNWKYFLGLVNGKSWIHVLFPSRHKPPGNGLSWHTTLCCYDSDCDDTSCYKDP